MARRQAAPALRVRQQAAAGQGQDRRRHVVGRHPDLQVAGPRHRVPDAARHLHAGRRRPRMRSTTTSSCSRRCARRRNGRSSWTTAPSTTTFMTGADYAKWVENEEKRHRDLMKEAGFLANQLIARPTPCRSVRQRQRTAMSDPCRIPRASSGPRQRHVEMGVAAVHAGAGRHHHIGSLQVGIGWGAEGPNRASFRSGSG